MSILTPAQTGKIQDPDIDAQKGEKDSSSQTLKQSYPASVALARLSATLYAVVRQRWDSVSNKQLQDHERGQRMFHPQKAAIRGELQTH